MITVSRRYLRVKHLPVTHLVEVDADTAHVRRSDGYHPEEPILPSSKHYQAIAKPSAP